jgi:hypothetical protein
MVSAKQLGLAVAILSVCGLGHAEENITSDTYFYGQSEAVYPSRMFKDFLASVFSANVQQHLARVPVIGPRLTPKLRLWLRR